MMHLTQDNKNIGMVNEDKVLPKYLVEPGPASTHPELIIGSMLS